MYTYNFFSFLYTKAAMFNFLVKKYRFWARIQVERTRKYKEH